MREQEEREQGQADSSRNTAEFRAFAHQYGEDPEATATWSAAAAGQRTKVMMAAVGAGVVVVILLVVLLAVG
ncbi:MAG TPA: hypothetical protein VGS19_29380 [Streptosporangiaceae bacterium]|nr:hypothetical protein [Streptosporangiaceae bacterium]